MKICASIQNGDGIHQIALKTNDTFWRKFKITCEPGYR